MSKEFEQKVLEFIDISQNNFKKLDNKIDALESKMNNRIDTLEITMNDNIANINTTIETLTSSVILIEHKVMTEFPSLLEAFDLHLQMHKDCDEKNSYLSAKVEEDSMRISILEDQMKFIKNN